MKKTTYITLKIKNIIFNFQGIVPMIPRSLTPKLLKMLDSFPVVCLTGARQSGKTTLARSLAPHLSKPMLYLDAERSSDAAKLHEAELFLTEHQQYCVVIDEVQRLPNLFPLLRSLVDDDRQGGNRGIAGRFLLLGSAAPDLMRQASESLAGRIATIELSPFHRAEIADSVPLVEHWLRGGFPGSVLADDDDASAEWRAMFVSSYLERDLAQLGFSFTPALMRRLWVMLAHYHGSLLNASDLASALGVSAPTVNRYLDILEGAYVLYRLMPFHVNTKKRLVKSPKIYLRDSGIVHSLLNLTTFAELSGHPVCGRSWEGYALEQILSILPRGTERYFYRTHAGAELDLLLVREQRVIASVEMKYSSQPTLTQGNITAAGDVGAAHQYVVIPHGAAYTTAHNRTVAGLDAFLDIVLSLK
jgi:uncharacterized protein